jgi:hypothetical protein
MTTDLINEALGQGWYHTIDLGPGISTPGAVDLRALAPKVLPHRLDGLRALLHWKRLLAAAQDRDEHGHKAEGQKPDVRLHRRILRIGARLPPAASLRQIPDCGKKHASP